MTDRVDFDKFTDDYNKLLADQTRFFSSNDAYFAKYKVDLVRHQLAASPKRILEYGCGIGRNISFLRNAFPEATVVGSDISRASLDYARADNPEIEFFAEDERPLPQPAPFDLIFVAGVYHHVPEEKRSAVTQVLYDRLTQGGQLFVFEHNPFNPITRHIVNTCPYDADASLIKPASLATLLKDAGFLVKRHAYCLFIPPRLAGLKGLESLLKWLPLGGQYWIQAERRI